MRSNIWKLVLCVTLLLTPAGISGQGRSLELGFGAALMKHLGDRTASELSFPTQSIRFGVFAFEGLFIEPSMALTLITAQNDDTIASTSFWFSALYHLTSDRTKPRFFVRPAAGIDYHSTRADNESLYHAGGYLGLKIPAADHLSIRLETGYQRRFESNGIEAGDAISLSIGISWFLGSE